MDDDTPRFGEEADDVREIDWIDAPADSHLKCFRFTNRYFSNRGGPSVLWVTFRATVTKRTGTPRPEVTYRYESLDHISLRGTFEKMTIASSPGEVLHADLISQGNKGTPT
jgi:hypothetical protein